MSHEGDVQTTSSDGSPASTDEEGEGDAELFEMEAGEEYPLQLNDSGFSGNSNVTQKLQRCLEEDDEDVPSQGEGEQQRKRHIACR